VWTHQERAALVMTVNERGKPLADTPKTTRLHQMLESAMGWAQGEGEGRVEVQMVGRRLCLARCPPDGAGGAASSRLGRAASKGEL
jgi:hypothetical protein